MTAQHSPLGGSGAERWFNCPGSVSMSEGITDDESDYATLGTAAHALGAQCLTRNVQPWRFIGDKWAHGDVFIDAEDPGDPGDALVQVDKDMADAVQTYIYGIREWHPDRHQGNSWVERHFACPSIHKFFYGTADFVFHDEADRALHVWDYKHGQGVMVDVHQNLQTMYYACGALEDLQLWHAVDRVVLHIAQPRGFHSDGPIRAWEVPTNDLFRWMEDELVPAMDRALTSLDTASGEHCRFCPVRKYACPQLLKDREEMEKILDTAEKAGGIDKLTNDQVARYLDLQDVMKIAGKAAASTGLARALAGQEIPGRKVVKAKSDREWKPEAEAALIEKYGENAYKPKALKSPADVDKLPEGNTLTARYANKPDKGYSLAKGTDSRGAVTKSVKQIFQANTQEPAT